MSAVPFMATTPHMSSVPQDFYQNRSHSAHNEMMYYYGQKPANNNRRRIEPVRYKTRMCRHFLETGYCPFAPRCAFAHGEHELRTIQANATEGLTHISRLREYQCHNNFYNSHNNYYDAATSYNLCPCPDCYMMETQQSMCQCPDCVNQMTMYNAETGSMGSATAMSSLDDPAVMTSNTSSSPAPDATLQ